MYGNRLMMLVLQLYVGHSISYGNFILCQNMATQEMMYICLEVCDMYLTVASDAGIGATGRPVSTCLCDHGLVISLWHTE